MRKAGRWRLKALVVIGSAGVLFQIASCSPSLTNTQTLLFDQLANLTYFLVDNALWTIG
jgi:hypothetical protein